jgi:hypothetical protein
VEGHEASDGEPILRVTRRCLVEDLGFPAESLDLPIDDLARADKVIAAFLERRSGGVPGQEPIQSLLPGIVAFSLHVGRYRGATWEHRQAGIVWLVAVGYHTEGHADDAYERFAGLRDAGRLLPDREDMLAFVRSQAPTLARSLLEDAPGLVDVARQQPREIQEGVIGGRIRVRLVYEDSDPPMLTIAIGQRLIPGEMPVPADWVIRVAAAFLPDTPAEHLAVTFDLAGEELRPDEVAFCDFSDDLGDE